METCANFIGGEFKPAVGSKTFQIDDPSTNEPIADVPDSEILDVVAAIQAANKSLKGWQTQTESQRADLLLNLATQFEINSETLARAESSESGQPLSFVLKESLPRAIETLRTFSRSLHSPSVEARTTSGAHFLSNRLPIGVVVAICSYSDPVARMALVLGAALAGGNALILKSSSRTPRTAMLVAKSAADAGLPAGVFNLLQGRGETVGRVLLEHPGLSTISFTGRTENAREVQKLASEFLKRTHLALGATNPILVFAENDVAKIAAKVARLAFAPQGSVALRGARIFIQDPIYDSFLEHFKAESEKLAIGNPLDEKTQVGPLAKPADFEQFARAVRQATGERAKILCGSPDPRGGPGRFVTPTVLYDLTFCSTLQQEEVIGPIATVASFKYQHDAIKHANNSPFGQAAYVFHSNAAKATKVAMKLEAGRVFVGGGPLWDAHSSGGGVKLSGQGREGTSETLKFFSRESLIGFDISG